MSWQNQFRNEMESRRLDCTTGDGSDRFATYVVHHLVGDAVWSSEAEELSYEIEELTKSQIETAMLLGFLSSHCIDFPVFVKGGNDCFCVDRRGVVRRKSVDDYKRVLLIRPQHRIERYTADFMLDFTWGGQRSVVRAVVECDGHDYHERTKEQAAHDRQRDRELQNAGYLVLRYTGSEIWKAPVACAASAIDAVDSAHNKLLKSVRLAAECHPV